MPHDEDMVSRWRTSKRKGVGYNENLEEVKVETTLE